MNLRIPLVSELNILGCTSYPRTPWHWPLHLHAFHQFDVVLSGEVFFELASRKPARLRRGHAVLIPPMVRHGYRTRMGFRHVVFKFHISPCYWSYLGKKALLLKISPASLASVERTAAAWKAQRTLSANQAAATLTGCLVEAARGMHAETKLKSTGTEMDAFRTRLWPVLERVDAEPFRKWTVAGLAAALHLTPDHFSVRFRNALDQPPLEYLLRARMRAAAHELSSQPGLPIKEVAAAAGYATVHAFTRAFRRVTGASPGRFRRMPSDL